MGEFRYANIPSLAAYEQARSRCDSVTLEEKQHSVVFLHSHDVSLRALRGVCELPRPSPLVRRGSSSIRSHQKRKTARSEFGLCCGRICPILRGSHRERWDRDSNSAPLRKLALRSDSPQESPKKEKQHDPSSDCAVFGDSWENRTPVSALRGPCLSRLTKEPCFCA